MNLTPENSTSSGLMTGDQTLWLGDRGVLSLQVRTLITYLKRGPSLDGTRSPELWQTLLLNEAIVRSRLHDDFLDLVFDRDEKIAFIRQAQPDDHEAPILLRRTPLSFLQSILVLFLREKIGRANAEGNGRAVVSSVEMMEHMLAFEGQDRDEARFQRQRAKCIEKMQEINFITKLKGSAERFEVSPAIKLLVTAEMLESMGAAYLRQTQSPPDNDGTTQGLFTEEKVD